MTAYSAETLDLSRLPAPTIVEVDFEARRAALLAEFQRLWAIARGLNPSLPDYDVTLLETDPAVILTEEFAFGDIALRQAINDAANTLRLAKAVGPDLAQIAATFHRTQRKILVPANPDAGLPAVEESDDDLRARAQLAPEALSDLGLTPGGYIYKVRTAFADRIKHCYQINRGAGRVELRVLGRAGDGTVGPALLAEIIAAFSGEDGAQTTDVLTVLSADVVPVVADVTLLIPRGPDPTVVIGQARTNLTALGTALHRLNAPYFREALSAAAHTGPVITVRVNAPSTDRLRAPEVAPYLTADAISVTHEIL